MKSRNEIGKNIFDLEEESFETVDDGWNRQTLSAVEDNTVMVRQREREIQKIVQSIAELNAIFKDLATMVSEQVMISACFGGSQTRDLLSFLTVSVYQDALEQAAIFCPQAWSSLARTGDEGSYRPPL